MPQSVKEKYANEHYAVALEPLKKHWNGDIAITPFNVPHEDVENYAYIISEKSIGKMLYMVDCEYCPYDLSEQNLSIIAVECNYDKRYIGEDAGNRSHVFLGHMELQTCLEFLEVNKSPALRQVILCHLSQSGNADADHFLEVAKKVVGCEVNIAELNAEIILDEVPF